tara:strand:- start:3075 stop:4436 length:1362 start_codon:yes stop_codon:yes gene_type:complete
MLVHRNGCASVRRMRPLFFALLVSASVASCTKANPNAPDAGSTGSGSDADVSPDANLEDCTPNSSVCADDVETVCDADGSVARETTCALGCFDDERCGKMNPSNGMAPHLDDAANGNDVVFSGTATIDTSAGTVTDVNGTVAVDTVLEQGGPVDVFVVKVKSLTATDINVVGTAALAIVSDGDVTIDGVLDVSGHFGVSGPGAMTSEPACLGGVGAVSNSNGVSGGGGGGFGGAGGLGGSTLLGGGVNGGSGGNISGNPEITPLRGGCDGALAGRSGMPLGVGGGAIQIVSNSAVRLELNAAVAANGSGGGTREKMGPFLACILGEPCFSGAGGGSGGAIVIEALAVTLAPEATLLANGGGGGCGIRTAGEDGQVSLVPAEGGDCDSAVGGNGGAGSEAAGADGTSRINGADSFAGGGGGGVGRIRINLPAGETFAPEGLVSPPNTAGVLGIR